MISTSIFCGALLILIGVVGYVYGMNSGTASLTALIPAAFGLVLLLSGAIASTKESLRKHVMHVAVVVALIGFLMTAGRMIMRLDSLSMSPAVISQAATAIICLIFVLAGIRSFAAARRDRI